MRLIHLTDPHLTTPPPLRSLVRRSQFGKRYLGYASWARNRRFSLRREWLDELTERIATLEPDLLLLTGDLTQIGTAEEIGQAREWLDGLRCADRICFVPGNHDSYAPDSWPRLEQELAVYLPELGRAGFPFLRQSDGVAVLGVSSAVPTAPLSATGLIGAEQLQRLATALAETGDSAIRILLLHHPPLPGMIKFRKRLRDAEVLGQLLEEQPVDLILHGHRHRNQSSTRAGLRIYGTAPASAEAASFRVFDIDHDATGHHIDMALWQRQADSAGSAGFEVTENVAWVVNARG